MEDEILIKFKADLAGLKTDLKTASSNIEQVGETAKATDKKVAGIGDTVKNNVSKQFQHLKGTIAAAFALHAITGFAEKLFEMQDALEQVDRKAQVVFKTTLPEMTAAAEKNANAIGLTKAQYTDAAASITLFLKNTGFTEKESAKLAQQLLETGSNLALVNTEGKSAKDIALQLANSFSGNTKSLKDLGFNIKLTKTDLGKLGEGLDDSASATQKKTTALSVMNQVMTQSQEIVGDLNSELFSSEKAELESEARLAEKMDELARKSAGLKEAWLDLKIGALEMLDAMSIGWGRLAQDIQFTLGLASKSAEDMHFIAGLEEEANKMRLSSARSLEKKINETNAKQIAAGEEGITNEELLIKLQKTKQKLKDEEAAFAVSFTKNQDTQQRANIGSLKGEIDAIQNIIAQRKEEAKISQQTGESINTDIDKTTEKIQTESEILLEQNEIWKKVFDERARRRKEEEKLKLKDETTPTDDLAKTAHDTQLTSPLTMTDEEIAGFAAREEMIRIHGETMRGLGEIYENFFFNMTDGWLEMARAQGMSQTQVLILEKLTGLAKLSFDYIKARFAINAQFAALIANPLTAGVGVIQRQVAMSALNSSFGLNLAAFGAVAIPEVVFSAAKGFNKGVDWVPGFGNKDTVPAMLTPGERVTPAEKNKRYWDELNAIQQGTFEEFINQKYIMPALMSAANNATTGERMANSIALQNWKGENLVSEMWKGRIADKENTKAIVGALESKKQSKRAW